MSVVIRNHSFFHLNSAITASRSAFELFHVITPTRLLRSARISALSRSSLYSSAHRSFDWVKMRQGGRRPPSLTSFQKENSLLLSEFPTNSSCWSIDLLAAAASPIVIWIGLFKIESPSSITFCGSVALNKSS